MIGARERYATRWPASQRLFERALVSLPGGNTRTQLHLEPFPLYASHGAGARLTLADGAEVDDFLLNYTAAAVGHAHPSVLAAAYGVGAPLGLATERELALAEAIVARFPAVESVRFTCSGSEATLHALRAARAFTGRPLVAMAQGGYHGSYDLAGAVELPWNDPATSLAVLDRHRGQLATVILEPFLNSGGAIPADRGYLAAIAEWCTAHGVLLTVDEVASWRTGFSGAAHDLGLAPDLVCLGKALGGGFPFGAVGGRGEVMEVFDPRRPAALRHAGTFNAHPGAMAAGQAVLEILDRRTVEAMNWRGRSIAAGVAILAEKHGVALCATTYGSIGRLHVSATPPRSAVAAAALPRAPLLTLYRLLLERGVLIGPEGRFSICSETTDGQVTTLLAALDDAIPALLDDPDGLPP